MRGLLPALEGRRALCELSWISPAQRSLAGRRMRELLPVLVGRRALCELLFVPLLLAGSMAGAERVIIDTDCGYFGDDGSTLVMLLRSNAVQVEAITIVSGNVWAEKARHFTREIVRLTGKGDIPIYLGAEQPLRHTPEMADEEKRRWGPMEFRGAFDEPRPAVTDPLRHLPAVSEIIRRVERAPGQITIAGLGPMTNLALALEERPDIAGKIRRLVFMGGQLRVKGNSSPEAEFNFWFDPEAASAVLRSAIPEKIMFGLDICDRAMLDKKGFDEIVEAQTPVTERFREDFGVRYPGFLKNPKASVSLWDALVAAWMIRPELFRKPEKLSLDVDTTFGPKYGKVKLAGREMDPKATQVSMMNNLNYPGVYALFRDLLREKR
jgi:inosine-uridine nucleoside N-ribohydrolase